MRDASDADEPEADDFVGDSSPWYVTFLDESAAGNSVIGAYSFDVETGEIGEGQLLFVRTQETAAGATASVQVEEGDALGVFMVPNTDRLEEYGIDVSDYGEGGLNFENFLAKFEMPGDRDAATIEDSRAPRVVDDGETPMPFHVFHALGNDDGLILLWSLDVDF